GNLLDCAHSLEELRQNSSFKRTDEINGSQYHEGNASWLKEKAKVSKERDVGKLSNPKPTLFEAVKDEPEPDASTLWRTPKAFGMDADDRTLSYETVVDCLDLVGIHGCVFYHQVKTNIKDPDDKEWMTKDSCCICQDKQLDITKGCPLACTDKKKYYCDQCVSKIQEQWGDDQGRILCPFCQQLTYFVSTKWIFVNDETK
ncbi:hypothetical protein AAF712_015382, partial [Marasmius tenuissimus]